MKPKPVDAYIKRKKKRLVKKAQQKRDAKLKLERQQSELLMLVNMAEDALCEALCLESSEDAKKMSQDFFNKLAEHRSEFYNDLNEGSGCF